MLAARPQSRAARWGAAALAASLLACHDDDAAARARTGPAAGAPAAAAPQAAVPQPPQAKAVPVRYTVRGREVRLDLHLDRAGLVLHDKVVAADHAKELPAGTQYLESLAGLLEVYDLPGDETDRDALADLTEDLDEHASVHLSGMLVTHAGAEEPLLMTDEVIVRFHATATDAEVAALLAAHGLRLLQESEFDADVVLVAPAPDSGVDAVDVCNLLEPSPLVDWAEPNFVHPARRLSARPQDLFAHQWHLENTGQGAPQPDTAGTPDADIDAPQAWAITPGRPETVIAVLEDGFDVGHPDLVPNLWTDPATGEPGRSFFDCKGATGCSAGLDGDQDDPSAIAHGTAVAGLAAARGDDGSGVSGSCPACSLMLIRRSLDAYRDGEAIRYAASRGASVISNSWRYSSGPPPQNVKDAIHEAVTLGRGGKGCVVLFGVPNVITDVDGSIEICTLPDVVTVASIANNDQRVERCGYGDCVDVLGPSRYNRSASSATGTLDVATTDWRGPGKGYNADPALQTQMMEGWSPCAEATSTGDYTLCFGGNSAATPIVAGVAALVLSAAPELTGAEVRRLLRDTADRADDAGAAYGTVDGRSTTRHHGSGRVNAFEAVRVVAPHADGGRGGVDLLLRDNRLDWGNTEQPSDVLLNPRRGTIAADRSPDVKLDAEPFAEVRTSREFEAFADEALVAGKRYRVRVRVRNRGPRTAVDVGVALLWTRDADPLPPLPSGWAASALAGAETLGAWTSVGRATGLEVPYSGSAVAGTAEDAAPILAFDFRAPPQAPAGRSYAVTFLALAACAEDPIAGAALDVEALVPRENNVTLRAVQE